MSVDKILTIIRSYSLQGKFQELNDYIFNESSYLKNNVLIDDVINSLELSDHSAAILSLLLYKISTNHNQISSMVPQIIEFLNDCNEEQVKMVGNQFSRLCHFLADHLVESNQPLKGIDPISKAIVKIQRFPSQLTSIHAVLCKLALLSKCVKPALVFLDIEITDINKESDRSDVKYFLLYYFYGGIIYSIMQNLERSFLFFQSAISITGSAISQITIESYKKYILVSLLLHGRVFQMPKQIKNYLNRSVRPFCKAYTQLAIAFAANSFESMNEVLEKHKSEFQTDQNLGLVKQVMSSLVKIKMRKLTKTFLTLPLKDMAERVQLNNAQEAEKKILQMIEDEEIFATIDQKNGMVKFSENPEKYNTLQMYRRIEDQICKCMNLNEKLKNLDQEIATNQKYISKIRWEMNEMV